jgi:transcriptional regulator with XRE-family HTH domain
MAPESAASEDPRPFEFGRILRQWRRIRGISQLDLANLAGTSARHLSFLENGRCGPSRSAVLQLGRALELPGEEIERLLIVAGYAGDWTRRSADKSLTRKQLEKVAHLLAAHDPFPAIISDPDWGVVGENRGARAFFRRLRELEPGLGVDPVDLRQLLVAQCLGQVVPNLRELLEGVLIGLYQLEPDPVCFGHARSLMDILPAVTAGGVAIERAARTTAWEHEMRVRDRGREFSVELLSLPFAGGASGFTLVLACPADERSRAEGNAYFAELLERRGA